MALLRRLVVAAAMQLTIIFVSVDGPPIKARLLGNKFLGTPGAR